MPLGHQSPPHMAGIISLACILAILCGISCPLAGASRILLHGLPGTSSHLFGLLAIGNELSARGHTVAALIKDWQLLHLRSGDRPKLPPTNVTFIVVRPFNTPEEGLRLFNRYRDIQGSSSVQVRSVLAAVAGPRPSRCPTARVHRVLGSAWVSEGAFEPGIPLIIAAVPRIRGLHESRLPATRVRYWCDGRDQGVSA